MRPSPRFATCANRAGLVADLSWTKLTGLRELIASLFDEGATAGVKSARIFYGAKGRRRAPSTSRVD